MVILLERQTRMPVQTSLVSIGESLENVPMTVEDIPHPNFVQGRLLSVQFDEIVELSIGFASRNISTIHQGAVSKMKIEVRTNFT